MRLLCPDLRKSRHYVDCYTTAQYYSRDESRDHRDANQTSRKGRAINVAPELISTTTCTPFHVI